MVLLVIYMYICNMKIITKCKCGNDIHTTEQRAKEGRGKFCSQSCKYKYREMPKRGKGNYKLVKENPTSFKKGHKTWCEGTKGLMVAWNKGLKGVIKPNITSFKKGENISEDNNKWKGYMVGYVNLHTWVKRHLGKAKKCEKCESEVNVQWANKSHEYKRDLTDWLQLCHKCHRKYDSGVNWGSMKKYFDKKLNRL